MGNQGNCCTHFLPCLLRSNHQICLNFYSTQEFTVFDELACPKRSVFVCPSYAHLCLPSCFALALLGIAGLMSSDVPSADAPQTEANATESKATPKKQGCFVAHSSSCACIQQKILFFSLRFSSPWIHENATCRMGIPFRR